MPSTNFMSSSKNRFLYASLLLNLLFIVASFYLVQRFGGFRFFVLRMAKVPNGIDFYNRTSHFETLPDIDGEIFFLGNSLTEQANWNELFHANCLNRAISGDDTERLLQRMDDIVKRKPSKVFIMIGINDLSRNASHAEILENYRQILTKLRSGSPRTRVYVQSILPVNNILYNHRKNNSDINTVNAGIRSLASEMDCTYIDLSDRFTDAAGNLAETYTIDGAHLNGQGYLLWRDVLAPYVYDRK